MQQQQLYLHQLSDLRLPHHLRSHSAQCFRHALLPTRKNNDLRQQPVRQSLTNHRADDNNANWSDWERVVSSLTPRFMILSLVHQLRLSGFHNINPPGRDPPHLKIKRSPWHHFKYYYFRLFIVCFGQNRCEYMCIKSICIGKEIILVCLLSW